jgi:hypothetical protein
LASAVEGKCRALTTFAKPNPKMLPIVCSKANVRGKNQKSKLTSVDIPTSWPSTDQLDDPQIPLTDPKVWDKDDKPFCSLTLPDEITKYLTARNRRHFGA